MVIRSFFVISHLWSCGSKRHNAYNSIETLSDDNPEISISHWRIIGPFVDTASAETFLALPDPASPLSLTQGKGEKVLVDTLYEQRTGFFVDFGEVFGYETDKVGYALCTIRAEKESEVAFLVGADDNIRLWVNGKLVLQEEGERNFRKNQYINKVVVQPGDNDVMVEMKNIGEGSRIFRLDIATINHVRYNALLFDHYGNCVNPLLPINDSLELRVSTPDFIPINKSSTFKVYDFDDRIVLEKLVELNRESKIAVDDLKSGVYRYTLITDLDTLDGLFLYGSLDHVYQKEKLVGKYQKDKKITHLLSPYFKRIDNLIGSWLASNKRKDVELERKIVYCVYKILEIDHKTKNGHIREEDLTGLQVKSYISPIDKSEEYFILYIPKNRRIHRPSGIPLVVVVPYVTGKHKLYVGAVMANSNRMSYISKFAEENGVAVLWTSARVFEKYNMTPIMTKSIEDNLKYVNSIYNIDNRRVYLYGDCSGGLFTLLSAIRKPDLFAAIAVEGPELRSVDFDAERADLSVVSNDIFAMSDNLDDKPILFIQSPNDFKSKPDLTLKLIALLQGKSKLVRWDRQRDGAKGVREINGGESHFKMSSEPESMRKVLDFFQSVGDRKATIVRKFSSYAVYNDTIYGIYIKEKERAGIARVAYSYEGNILEINTSNVTKFSFNLDEIDVSDTMNMQIRWNDQSISKDLLKKVGNQLIFESFGIKGNRKKKFFSKHLPINYILREPFAVGRSKMMDGVSLRVASDLDSLWQEAYGVNLNLVSLADREEPNMDKHFIDFNNGGMRCFPKWLMDALASEEDNIKRRIFNKGYLSNHISYAFTDTLSSGKFRVVVGTTGNEVPHQFLTNLIQKGWENVVFWDNRTGEKVFGLPERY